MFDKNKKRDPYHLYVGNLFSVTDGIGTISPLRYVIIREKKHLFATPHYYAHPSGKEILVGSYEITNDGEDQDVSFLINATRLNKIVGSKNINFEKIEEVLLEANKDQLDLLNEELEKTETISNLRVR